jgi:predicted O-methyltransferase YrrM
MSTLWLASAVEPTDGHVYTWDIAKRNFLFKGTDVEPRITFTEGDFAEKVGEVIALNPPHPWLFFIDGAFLYEKNKEYWEAIVHHLEQNDYVVFHDTIQGITSPHKRRRGMLVNEIKGTVNLPGYTGVAVYRHVS